MTRTCCSASLAVALLFGDARALSEPASERLVCNLRALDPARRQTQVELTRRLLEKGILERRELPTGFELRVNAAAVSLIEVATWVDGERRCCPFLHLTLDQEPHAGALWLRLTGPTGVKDFLLAELSP